MPYAQEWNTWAADHVARLREEAVSVADRLDAALGVQAIVAAVVADLDDTERLSYDDLLQRQATELDRAELAAKVRRMLDDPDQTPDTHKEHTP